MLLIFMLLFGAFPMGQALAGSSDVYINEMQVSTTGTDWEFFELQGTPGTDLSGLTLVGIESDNYYAAGTIDVVISLAGQSIPSDGFFVGINDIGASTYGITGDMSISDNSFENSTATYFLVSGFTGSKGLDYDADDDGVLDSTPWAFVLDALNIRDSGSSDFDYSAPSVGPDGYYLPSGTFRCPDAPWGSFNSNILNFSSPNGTPGTSNRETCGIASVYINEMQVSTTGTDWEFFELQGTPGTDLSGLTLVGIESDDYYAAGTIDVVISLAGQSIPSDGFWVGINGLGAGTYVITGDMSISDNSFENSTATYFLVSGFTGAKFDDLDTDNDGNLDVFPWAFVIDALNIRDGGSTDFDYGAPSVGPDGYYLPSGTFRCPDAPDGTFDNNNMLNFSLPDGTPGITNGCTPPPVTACGEPYTPIYTVQGSGFSSPLDGSLVDVEGIVTGDFQDGKSGFTIQDAFGDGDAATSDGIFVYAYSPDVNVGDHVRVTGYVDEYYDLTEITSVSDLEVCSIGNAIPATPIFLPLADTGDLEAYEGMLVTFVQSLYISEYFDFARYGEIVLSTARQFQPTAVYEPGSPEAAALAEANQLSRIKLDDGRGSQNPDPALHPNGSIFDLTNLFRGGDVLNNLTGIVDYNFDEYKIQPTQGADYISLNLRTAQPNGVGGNLKVASFNVLNYFTTLDSRGANDPIEFQRQRDKIFAALADIDADVVGLIEIENNGTAVQDLVDGLNGLVGAGTYAYIDTGFVGVDEITVAFIYKPATVSLVGDYAVLDDPAFTDPLGYGEQKSRPALAQTFMDNSTGGVFTAIVNHLKSKGSSCGEGDDDPEQGSCNLTRTLAAQTLVDWLATDPTGSGDNDFLIIGDLNAYDKEDPIDAVLAGGYTDLVYQYIGEDAYSYVFDGQLGYLDHALANQALVSEISGVTIWHINADESSLIDYDTSYKQDVQDAIYAPDAYRSSDHDPVLIGMNVCDEIAPTLEVSVSPDTLWPPNHKYTSVTATVTASDNFDTNPTVTLISVTSNELDNGEDDGDTVDDIVIIDDFTFDLRAERSGIGSGRIYTITYEVTDACGNTTMQSATVIVPLSMGE